MMREPITLPVMSSHMTSAGTRCTLVSFWTIMHISVTTNDITVQELKDLQIIQDEILQQFEKFSRKLKKG